MRHRLVGWLIGVVSIALAGTLIATAEQRPGPALIAGDQPVTEEQIRGALESDGYANLQIVRRGQYFDVVGSKNGQIEKLVVDQQTGRLAAEDDDDDD